MLFMRLELISFVDVCSPPKCCWKMKSSWWICFSNMLDLLKFQPRIIFILCSWRTPFSLSSPKTTSAVVSVVLQNRFSGSGNQHANDMIGFSQMLGERTNMFKTSRNANRWVYKTCSLGPWVWLVIASELYNTNLFQILESVYLSCWGEGSLQVEIHIYNLL